MSKITSYTLCFVFLLSAAHPIIYAQQLKQETEKSINRDDMPANASTLLNEFWNEQKKADFYRESDGEKISYEAKLNWEGYQYSIEFDENGLLQDIEQLIGFKEIPEALRNTITENINKQYSKFRINRVQRQFMARNSDQSGEKVVEALKKGDFDGLIIRYEIEIDGQNKEELGSFELLFDDNGQHIRKRKIVRRSLDNIW